LAVKLIIGDCSVATVLTPLEARVIEAAKQSMKSVTRRVDSLEASMPELKSRLAEISTEGNQ